MPVELAVTPIETLGVVTAAVCGICLGAISGLIPGIHANNFALVLASVAAAVPGDPLLIGVAMLAAGVTHSFLNVVPTLAIGVPDAEMAPVALPGHRLVLEGRGYEAIRLSALGSGLAVLIAVPLAVPITWLVESIYPTLSAYIEILLAIVVGGMILSEPTWRNKLGAVLAVCLSTLLGIAVLDLEPAAPLDAGGMLAPIFAGLFGAPILIDAMTGKGVPRQGGTQLEVTRRRLGVTAVAGAVAGAIVGYLPGISAAIAAVAVLAVLPSGVDARGYVAATSGVDTSNAIFALFALATIDRPRSGVMVAYDELGAPVDVPTLLAAIVFTGAIATVLVIVLGDRYLTAVGRINPVALSGTVLGLLVVLSWLLAGGVGVCVFVIATVIGFVPVRLGAYRVHLMSVLMGPIIIGI